MSVIDCVYWWLMEESTSTKHGRLPKNVDLDLRRELPEPETVTRQGKSQETIFAHGFAFNC